MTYPNIVLPMANTNASPAKIRKATKIAVERQPNVQWCVLCE